MLQHWWASAESKYWCSHCYFQCWRTTNLQFVLLFTTLFIQPVQIEPQPPPIHLLSSLFPSPTVPHPPSAFAFPLHLCVMTWPTRTDTIPDTVYRERHRCKCHTDRNSPCDECKWMQARFLCQHTRIRNRLESISITPFLCEKIKSNKQIVS